MARTEQWIKKLGGHAGELFVCAELSKRGVPNALLPENFSDDDVLIGDKAGTRTAFIQVKACYPDRSRSFILTDKHEDWAESAQGNQFCILVWFGATTSDDPPVYWIAKKKEVGEACKNHGAHGSGSWERRFFPNDLPSEWRNRWSLFDAFRPHAG